MPWGRSQTLRALTILSMLCYAVATSPDKRALNGGTWVGSSSTSNIEEDIHEPPEGYYAFIESPNAEPPKVRRPPYQHTNARCPGIGQLHPHASLDNLCGDLNQGVIPRNPMDQNVMGSSYPFAIIKNKTLEFFSKTLPILKEDDTLPKVAKYQQMKKNTTSSFYYKDTRMNSIHHRMKREDSFSLENVSGSDGAFNGLEGKESIQDEKNITHHVKSSTRQSRKFCDNGGGVICMLYKAFRGEPLASGMGDRKDDDQSHSNTAQYRRGEVGDVGVSSNSIGRNPGPHGQGPPPPTPCPSKADYATPVFARNYQGVWRYVVQIPYEGYFTQTLEVTRCLQSRCHYMEGSCMASPRWVSLLVAEIFYPDSVFPSLESVSPSGRQPPRRQRPAMQSSERPPPSIHDFQDYQQYLHKRAGEASPGDSHSFNHHNHERSSDSNAKESGDNSEREAKSSGATGYCDGKDEMGCFQVRLYYDWFLIPGSCKCWRQDYFSRYANRKA